MVTVSASISKEYFGEPIYLRELVKDLTSAALGYERSELQFAHVINTDESPEASIVLTIDAVGNDSIGEQLAAALKGALSPAKLTFAVHFTQTAPDDIEFETSDKLLDAMEEAKQADSMLNAHLTPPSREDVIGEYNEHLNWHYSKLYSD